MVGGTLNPWLKEQSDALPRAPHSSRTDDRRPLRASPKAAVAQACTPRHSAKHGALEFRRPATRRRDNISPNALPIMEHEAHPARLAVLIPCFNEELTIADVVTDFRAALPSADVYVCDNNSPDQSVGNARRAQARVLHEPRQGKGYVLQAMFSSVDADIYVVVDGDGTYPAGSVRSLVEPIEAGQADMVIGSRLHRGAAGGFTTLHLWGNYFFVSLSRLLFGVPSTDLLSGYRALTREVARGVTLTSGGFEVETELTIKAIRHGFRVRNAEIALLRRPAGSSSKIQIRRDGLAILVEMLALFRRDNPSAFVSVMALTTVVSGGAVLAIRPRIAQMMVALVAATVAIVAARAIARRAQAG